MLAPVPLLDWKAVFRKRAKKTRARAALAQPGAAKFAANHFLTALDPQAGSTVALYSPLGDELDTAPLAQALAERGVAVALPVVAAKGQPLTFRLFEVDKPLIEGAYGVREPGPDAPERRPDIVVTPLLAARRADGARLGMGGGYYDRTLAALREDGAVVAVGYGYGDQLTDRFPVAPHDQFLDWFVSERGAVRFDRRR
ncbi:5-formyltetrahydrofolate cyclo-ligase [Parvularcula dongshanensis]|uniref:5-formyltetrahydrofolate cyclo-ligase n=1 Tax=Parvularcula dongshanensis TaxID=1173995 RepID=A0A840I7C5_9PROT|nr:5-formyltetrahydrofolate cyclo-ligase [Parvularcula dongshanensis]MBB4660153.1 5-formyltetrahydrofolate cyclo-ligase [Parvularcula dongshanensis]